MKDAIELIYQKVAERKLSKVEALELLKGVREQGSANAVLHPLVHQNTSTLDRQQFESRFSGEEFFLKDHVVHGNKVMPGVAYLEMARAATEAASDAPGSEKLVRLKNVVWARPVIVDGGSKVVDIGIFDSDQGNISYEVRTRPGDNGNSPLIHSRGTVEFTPSIPNPQLDLTQLQDEIGGAVVSGDDCYASFAAAGLDYGQSHQAIEELYLGSDQVLAKLCLPSTVSDSLDQFVLHPSLMDAAFQSTIGLALGGADTTQAKPMLPFALDSLLVFGKCERSMWVWVRRSPGSDNGSAVQRVDIDVCDDNGLVRVAMKGFSSRSGDESQGTGDTIGSLISAPVWIAKPVVAKGVAQEIAERVVICCGLDAEISCDTLVRFDSDDFEELSIQLFELIRERINSRAGGATLFQVLIPPIRNGWKFHGLSGMLRTAHLEDSRISGQIVEVDPDGGNLSALLSENGNSLQDWRVRYRDGVREVESWEEVALAENSSYCPWKSGGVYLITGGAGGLGLIFAREIATRKDRVKIVLSGRSPIDENLQREIASIEAVVATIEYRRSDLADGTAVEQLVSSIVAEHGTIDGILHSAGVIRDSFIRDKTDQEIREVMDPKVTGTRNLDNATKDLGLDFFVLFSAGAGVFGNPGQSDYAAANAYLDAFAHYRNGLLHLGERRGQTLSLDWPLWRGGGMRVDKAVEELMERNHGMVAMDAADGIRALGCGLSMGRSQLLVMHGNLKLLRARLFSESDSETGEKSNPVPVGEIEDGLLEKVHSILGRTITGILKIREEDIDIGVEFNEYGFDSVTLAEFSNQLNQEYQLELAPTLFFERPTMESLALFLCEEFPQAFSSRSRTPVESSPTAPRKKSRRVRISQPEPERSTVRSAGVAVIGMSGRFPMAKDLNAFWENLVTGRDCISEIPPDRWDWRAIYGDPHSEPNKTNIKWGGFIDGVGNFDPLFFGISPREAATMDPQQRLLMEYVWRAIEDAGYSAEGLAGSNTGIFVGTANTGYEGLVASSAGAIEGYSSTGLVPSVGPNRMSYFMDWHGPSEPVETACSSSLVAIHRAMLAMESGSCDMAVVGGVNTIVTPDAYISFNKAGMLCEDGRCKTFSPEANGYARGEGVGMLVLKDLAAAEAAGDHIYGVLRNSEANHGGRANSLTAPNPNAQAALLRAAYEGAGIDPGTVGYIEAHGTGTALGDPIEVNGLRMAFGAADDGPRDPSCGVGSVKSNIGHLELASGVAGVIKVLLQLKHETLVKSLHTEEISPYINLGGSPFYVVQENRTWERLRDDIPRRAGVSSFGFGGANAHVVIEEYVDGRKNEDSDRAGLKIIVLSARDEERLKTSARNLCEFLLANPALSLSDLAYTLQVGREPMEERLGIVVGSTEELQDEIGKFVDGDGSIEALFRGRVTGSSEGIVALGADEDMAQTIAAWMEKGKFSKLLSYWVRGLAVDWSRLYGGSRPRRISLPSYPFVQERHWVEGKAEAGSQPGDQGRARRLHPLLHENTSDLESQRFSSDFTGEEFFLADHRVRGERVLPGVAYLEIARVAAELAAGSSGDDNGVIQILNVVWARPLEVGEGGRTVQAIVFEEESRRIGWEIEALVEGEGEEPILHARGSVSFEKMDSPRAVNLPVLKSQINHQRLGSDECYGAFETLGLQYGPAYRGIEELWIGDDQVLAELVLPRAARENEDGFYLHPCVLDSALQATMGLLLQESGSTTAIRGPFLPFALRALEIHQPSSEKMWAWIRCSAGSAITDSVPKLDIDLCDLSGNVAVRMRDLSARLLEKSAVLAHPLLHENHSTPDGFRFSSLFSGEEFFFKDHSQFLPAVASLEMSLTAAGIALGREFCGATNIVWAMPIRVDGDPASITTSIVADGEAARFEISTQRGLHCRGTLISDCGDYDSGRASIQPEEIQGRCNGLMSAAECDALVAQSPHGASMLAIELLEYNGAEALATLALPECVRESSQQFKLHPSMLHGAILSAIALANLGDTEKTSRLPYGLKELKIFGAVPDKAYVHVRPADEGTTSYDLDLSDRNGEIAVSLRGLTIREAPQLAGEELFFAAPEWRSEPLPSGGRESAAGADPIFLLACGNRELEELVRLNWPTATVETLSGDGSDSACIQDSFIEVFDSLKGTMKEVSSGSPCVFLLVPENREEYLDGALSGLMATACLEEPRLTCRLVRFAGSAKDILPHLVAEVQSDVGGFAEVRYSNSGDREVRRLNEIELGGDADQAMLTSGDVVLITGGMGGLGRLVAMELSTCRDLRLILSGRSAIEDQMRDFLDELNQNGCSARYLQGDVSVQQEADELLREIETKFGKLSGVIHAAGVVQDSYILNKTVPEIESVFRAKVAGTLALDHAIGDYPLGFFVLFSSVSAFGSSGQADYAGANAFLDAFARHRNRRARTVSINWPLWQEGGMALDARTENLIRTNTGMSPMTTSAGLESLRLILNSSRDQVFVAYGDLGRIRRTFLPSVATVVDRGVGRGRPEGPAGGSSDLDQELVRIVAEMQQIEEEKIDLETELSKYGFDSISFMELADSLNKSFGLDLMPTVFFECPTLSALRNYLVSKYPDAVGKKPAQEPKPYQQVSVARTTRRRVNRTARRVPIERGTDEAIAIIGMSGRFPGSANLEEFWEHLEANRDLVSEVPADRWDWREIYGDPRKYPGKTKVKSGGFMEGVDCFDPLFFGISPLEAENMDPQLRIFLETVWATIEDAGYTASALSGTKTGVFVGVTTTDYKDIRKSSDGREGIQGSSTMFHYEVANRISYLLNLHGPSEPIDTACSSSLIAIHRAVESIRQGSCEKALVGGVNVIANPAITAGGSQAGMLSEDGRCKTFDSSADGYGRGEGVGAIFLKPLEKAMEDGDQIHGLVRGTAENHGGKATSPTAPNPVAQKNLLVEAYTRARVDPATVGYIEAHGTGTELGDPIEVSGLTEAFASLGVNGTSDARCALGSVKANIGHLEAAAGISGVIKVLLMMRNGKIPGNPHLKNPNPYLKLDGSPFYLPRDTQAWDLPTGDSARRAGVSSFGVGGANAHVIVEEFLPRSVEPETVVETNVVVLTAKDPERLIEVARNLLEYCELHQWISLTDLAYTLQVGRETMVERMAVVVDSIEELRRELGRFVAGEDQSATMYLGRAKRAGSMETPISSGVDFGRLTERIELARLAELWVRGSEVDWGRFYPGGRPRRISLPTYPFARERYWISEPGGQEVASVPLGIGKLHPLLHASTSELGQQKFTTTLTGKEDFLRDHVIGGVKLFPGVAYLEMARAAVAASSGREIIGLEKIAWIQPLPVRAEPKQVHIGLFPDSEDRIAFRIYTEAGDGGEEIVHSKGVARLGAALDKEFIDLDSLSACSESVLDADQCYDSFRSMGIDYGPTFQGIVEVQIGGGAVLAKLSQPPSGDSDSYILPPSLLDSALQATIGLEVSNNPTTEEREMMMPFAMQSLEIFGECATEMWAWIRPSSANNNKERESVRRLDFDLIDEFGCVCVRMNGFSSRVVRAASDVGSSSIEPTLAFPTWNPIPKPEARGSLSSRETTVIFSGSGGSRREYLEAACPEATVLEIPYDFEVGEVESRLRSLDSIEQLVWIAPEIAEHSPETLGRSVTAVFRIVKALLALGYGEKSLELTISCLRANAVKRKEVLNPVSAALYAWVGSVAGEYPNWSVRRIDLESDENAPVAEMLDLPAGAFARRRQRWFEKALIPIAELDQSSQPPRNDAVVVGADTTAGQTIDEVDEGEYFSELLRVAEENRRSTRAALGGEGAVACLVSAEMAGQSLAASAGAWAVSGFAEKGLPLKVLFWDGSLDRARAQSISEDLLNTSFTQAVAMAPANQSQLS